MAKRPKRPATKVIDTLPAFTFGGSVSGLPPHVIEERKELARILLDPRAEELTPEELPQRLSLESEAAMLQPFLKLAIPFPPDRRPEPRPLNPPPKPDAKLPKADVLVVTWTVDEQDALSDVLTPGFARPARRKPGSNTTWYPYTRNYEKKYLPQIRSRAPARSLKRLGNWMGTRIGKKDVICFKSELHLNQDGVNLEADGTPAKKKTGHATLPVKDLFRQLIDEVQPEVVITTGTSGGVFTTHDLGDVAVTRAALFRLDDEFKNEPFNHKKYQNDWDVPTKFFPKAIELMQQFQQRLEEPPLVPPTTRFKLPGKPPIAKPGNVPNIQFENVTIDGVKGTMPEFHPILTTDYFEFGTTKAPHRLDGEGCAVEMGDAVLGLVCSELDDPPSWVVVRNLSDPVINGDLPSKEAGDPIDMQAHWAVWYYRTYGYWTSVMSALTTWGIIAGLK